MAIEPSLNAAMDCTELERSIDAYVDGEFDAPERAEADLHLATCERCRALAGARAALRAAVRAKLREAMTPPAVRAPDALRTRIEADLARRRRPLWRRALSPIPVATLAACAAGAVVVFWTHAGEAHPGPLAEEAITSHHRDLPLDYVAASVGESALPAWFADKLTFRPSPPRFRAEGVSLEGARFSQLREWEAAYVRYRLPRGKAGLFIVDDPGGRFDVGGQAVTVGERTIRVARGHGYNVAVWRDDKIVYSLVVGEGDLDEAALRELVRTAQAGSGR
ncbi:MAG TPA: zf-HC2 domain-containing protein [Anaeromyxobacter sp.]|nr:zf-HC2 domain-containing protein [Anaeromyxobacter sp.]